MGSYLNRAVFNGDLSGGPCLLQFIDEHGLTLNIIFVATQESFDNPVHNVTEGVIVLGVVLLNVGLLEVRKKEMKYQKLGFYDEMGNEQGMQRSRGPT